MENEKILVMEEAPPDTSTYEDGSLDAKTEKPPEEKTGSFSFASAIEVYLNE